MKLPPKYSAKIGTPLALACSSSSSTNTPEGRRGRHVETGPKQSTIKFRVQGLGLLWSCRLQSTCSGATNCKLRHCMLKASTRTFWMLKPSRYPSCLCMLKLLEYAHTWKFLRQLEQTPPQPQHMQQSYKSSILCCML